MLVLCGCIGQSGGGWSHYVGQEKLRPQTGWLPVAFALDWNRPPRQMNSTSFFYAHTDQWRYETLDVSEILSPTAPQGDWSGSLIDYNVRAERMGWLPSAPQLKQNPLTIAAKAKAAGLEVKDYVAAVHGRRRPAIHDWRGDTEQDLDRRPAPAMKRTGVRAIGTRTLLPRSGPSGELAAQHVRLALQSARLLRQGPRVFPQAPARHQARRAGQGPRRGRPRQAAGRGLARPGAGGKTRPAGDVGFPHVHHLRVLGHRPAHRHLVREERPQHLRHAPVHPSAVVRGGSGLGSPFRLGHLQRHRQGASPTSPRKCWAAKPTWC